MDASSCQWNGCGEVLEPQWMLALVNRMGAVSSPKCNGMDDVNSETT